MWKIQDFCMTQILREINSRSEKTAFFAILGAVNFVHLVIVSLKVQKFTKIQLQEPLNVSKWLILYF